MQLTSIFSPDVVKAIWPSLVNRVVRSNSVQYRSTIKRASVAFVLCVVHCHDEMFAERRSFWLQLWEQSPGGSSCVVSYTSKIPSQNYPNIGRRSADQLGLWIPEYKDRLLDAGMPVGLSQTTIGPRSLAASCLGSPFQGIKDKWMESHGDLRSMINGTRTVDEAHKYALVRMILFWEFLRVIYRNCKCEILC